MRALIFGARGQLGRALIRTCPPSAEIVAIERSQGSIDDPARVEAIAREHLPTVIFNAAAYTAVDRAEADPEAAKRLNAQAPGIIATMARQIGAKLVHVSTDFVFDGLSGTPRRPDDPVAPSSVYGLTKLAGERAVSTALPTALIVRTAWLYAPGGANFVATMLRAMAERGEVRVVADQIGTPTSAASLAAVLWRLVGAGASGVYHVTDSGVASWYDFAVAIEEEAHALGLLARRARVVPIATSDYPTPARRPAYSVLDKSATWALLGEPAPHWRVCLRHALRDWNNG